MFCFYLVFYSFFVFFFVMLLLLVYIFFFLFFFIFTCICAQDQGLSDWYLGWEFGMGIWDGHLYFDY